MVGARGRQRSGRGTACIGVLLPFYLPAGRWRPDTGNFIAPALEGETGSRPSVARHSRRGIFCRAARSRNTGRFSSGYHRQTLKYFKIAPRTAFFVPGTLVPQPHRQARHGLVRPPQVPITAALPSPLRRSSLRARAGAVSGVCRTLQPRLQEARNEAGRGRYLSEATRPNQHRASTRRTQKKAPHKRGFFSERDPGSRPE